MSRSTIVLVPGAWHVPAHFAHVIDKLEAVGYACVGVNLPSNTHHPNRDDRLIGIEDDISAVRGAVLGQLDGGKDVVVVTHSYGSIPSTAALVGLGVKARKAAGIAGGVTAVVIISGFLLPPGSTMLAIMGGQLPPQYLHENGYTLPFAGSGALHVLYNELDHNEALKAVWRLKPQSYGVNTTIVPDQIAGLKGIPLSYLLCSKDNAVPWEAQTATVQGFRNAGVSVHAEIAESGHSPFLKVPDETAKFIRQAASEKIVTGFAQFGG